MGKTSVYIILIIVLTFFSHSLVIAKSLKFDTVAVKSNIPTEEKVNSYKTDSDFEYVTVTVPSVSFFDRIIDWILEIIGSLFSNNGIAPFIRYTLILALVVFIVMQLTGVKINKLFYKTKHQQSLIINSEEFEMTEDNFDEIIEKLISDGDFRKAIRFMYIKLLKMLGDKELITLKIHKTNNDYKNEMNISQYNSEFMKLSNLFEFVWYGDFAVDKDVFGTIQSDYKSIYSKLND